MTDALQPAWHRPIHGSNSPAALDVSNLEPPYQDLRDKALKQGVEWGACIVLESVFLSMLDQVRGTADSVTPLCFPGWHGDEYVGFLHVHLPIDILGGPYPGFSHYDYRAMIMSGCEMALVTNGPEVFGLVRTLSSPSWISDTLFAEWTEIYRNLLEKKESVMAIHKALWDANKQICGAAHLAFYQGPWGKPLELVFSPE